MTPVPRTTRTEDELEIATSPDLGKGARAVATVARAVAKARKVERKERGNTGMLPDPLDIAAMLRQVHGGRATDGITRNGSRMAGKPVGILNGIGTPTGSISPGDGSLDNLQRQGLAGMPTPWWKMWQMDAVQMTVQGWLNVEPPPEPKQARPKKKLPQPPKHRPPPPPEREARAKEEEKPSPSRGEPSKRSERRSGGRDSNERRADRGDDQGRRNEGQRNRRDDGGRDRRKDEDRSRRGPPPREE